MATKQQKDEVLKETKQINTLKLIRNKTKSKRKYSLLVRLIKIAETDLKAKRVKYGI